MRIFLDTSLLSESDFAEVGEEILEKYSSGDEFFVSAIVHFQIMWGYSLSGQAADKYTELLRTARVEVLPITKHDVEEAARMKPARNRLLDAMIAASVTRHDGVLWTRDRDFLYLLPKSKVRIFK